MIPSLLRRMDRHIGDNAVTLDDRRDEVHQQPLALRCGVSSCGKASSSSVASRPLARVSARSASFHNRPRSCAHAGAARATMKVPSRRPAPGNRAPPPSARPQAARRCDTRRRHNAAPIAAPDALHAAMVETGGSHAAASPARRERWSRCRGANSPCRNWRDCPLANSISAPFFERIAQSEKTVCFPGTVVVLATGRSYRSAGGHSSHRAAGWLHGNTGARCCSRYLVPVIENSS